MDSVFREFVYTTFAPRCSALRPSLSADGLFVIPK